MRFSVVCLFLLAVFALTSTVYSRPNVTEIIRSYGYETEEHWVLTLDGYYLLMNRIKTKGKPKGVIMFQHGLTDNSVGVCLAPRSEGLPWDFVDMGYEFWLGNNRGNGNSMKHVKWTPADDEFWDFSWQDMADFDFPAQIKYVLSVSGFSKLTYIGHSEGTIQAFAGFISHPEVADKVNLYVALAPVAYVAHIGSLVLQLLGAVDLDVIYEALGVHEFFLPTFIQQFIPNLCVINPSMCYFGLEALMGPSTHINVTRIPYFAQYEPNPTSVKNMAHWAQSTREGTYSKFDYGIIENLERYGTIKPPAYNITSFPTSLPVALFTGTNDYLADPKDVKRLLSEFPNSPLVYETDYGHIDFILAIDAKQKVYSTVAQLVQKFSSS